MRTTYDGGMLRKLLLLSIAAAICLQSQENSETFLLTIFLRHDQSKNVDQINEITEKAGFHDKFPPKGIEVVFLVRDDGHRPGGHVARLHPMLLLWEVNSYHSETSAWGGYRAEFYPHLRLQAYLAINLGEREVALRLDKDRQSRRP